MSNMFMVTIEESDILIFIPEGIKTFKKLAITIGEKMRNEINSQIIVFDEFELYKPLINFLQNMEKNEFCDDFTRLFNYATNIKDFKKYIEND